MAGAQIRTAIAALLAALLFLVPSQASAYSGLAGTPFAVCIRPADADASPLRLLERPRGFDCTTDQRRFGGGDFWVVSQPLRIAVPWPVRIRIASLWQDRATLWVRYADGATVRVASDGHALTRMMQLGAMVEYRLPERGVPVSRLLWRIDGASNMRGILVAPRIVTPAESASANIALAAIYGGFGGLCLALLIYNLALFGALRHRFQLAYCVMVASLLVYAASSSGALAWALPWIANNDRLRINYVALAVSAAAALTFARTFFEPRVFARVMGRAADAVTAALLGTAVVFVVLAPWQTRLLDQLYALSFAGLVAIAGPVLWRAWRLRSNYLWLFGLAWGFPIGFATLRILSNFGVIGWSFWVDNSTLIAMACEALTSSLAIAYRIRLLSRERDEAREQEIAARLLADIDPLTGLLNRRAFMHQAIGRAGDQTLLILDIDHFKRVNETIGHDGGDEVLRVVARALRRVTPREMLVARIGGEEFAIVGDAASVVAPEAVLDAVREQRMPFDVAVTASIGACTGALDRETDWKQLYRRADQALFAAKAAGRDRARDAGVIAQAA